MTGRVCLDRETRLVVVPPIESPLRLSVWEYEGGGLGPPRPPRYRRAEVAFDGVTILTAPGS